MKKGFSLIEILVVVAIFAVLGILISRAVILSVGGSRKTESTVKVRENLDYAMGVIERQVRNANDIKNPDGSPGCPNSNPLVFNYIDQDGNSASFSCVNIGGAAGYVASGSAALTSSVVNVTACSFSCQPGTGANPSTVTISLRAKDATAVGLQNADVTITNQVSLRNY